MSLSFCVLGSGSKGNCAVLVLRDGGDERYVLIDCGLSMRATARRLAPLGIGIEQVSAILLTHLDCDHYQVNWIRRIRAHGIGVYLHERHRNHALRCGLDGREIRMFREPFGLEGGTMIEPVMFAHDVVGSTGYIIEHGGARLGWATDLGRVPATLLDRFSHLQALAIESNYDREMQLASHRPVFLKRRIMNGSGHLSNEESLDAVLHIDGQSRLSHVVALHLSEQCNDPRLVKRLYAESAPDLLDRLTITHQRQPTPMLDVVGEETVGGCGRVRRRGEQTAMF